MWILRSKGIKRAANQISIARTGNRGIVCLLAAAGMFLANCTPNQRIIESSRTPEPPAVTATPASTAESEVEAMRNADFTYILVFRRKDGGVMNAEDKLFINNNTPLDVNRKTLSDGGRAVIVGSNFPFVPGSIEKLTDRFMMEDHSKADAGPLEEDPSANGNVSSNSNKGQRGNSNRAADTDKK